MKVLFLCQSKTLAVFHAVARAWAEGTERDPADANDAQEAEEAQDASGEPLAGCGYFVADSAYYEEYLDGRSEADLFGGAPLLKEWEILARAASHTVDGKRLREAEARYGDPVLWNAVTADRRLSMGPRAVLTQDYRARYGHDRLRAILQCTIDALEAFFDQVQPDLVVSFICVTLGEYLAERIAKARGIRFVNLRPTRIRNHFLLAESAQEPSARVGATMDRFAAEGVPEALRAEAERYLAATRGDHAMYEGVLPPPGTHAEKVQAGQAARRRGPLARLGRWWARRRAYTVGPYRHDGHYQGTLWPLWFKRVVKPLRLRAVASALAGRYVQAGDLAALDYAFYPLHKEPEVTLLAYSRPWLNQIEVVRNLARSLPTGMILLVKEHPAALGYRKPGYYEKLLAAPNVRLAAPSLTSREVLARARLVAVISGGVGFEAAIRRLPVLHFGHVPFEHLPDGMMRRVDDLFELPAMIQAALTAHTHDEEALVRYVAAVMRESVAVDWYTTLLGRAGVRAAGGAGDGTAGGDVEAQTRRLVAALRREAGR